MLSVDDTISWAEVLVCIETRKRDEYNIHHFLFPDCGCHVI